MFSAKAYELPITKNYINHWGMIDGVRELIQNALDSDSPFEWHISGGVLSITSRFSKLEPKTLLLGSSTKTDNKDKIGSFGEGYKLAMLVLHRSGYAVRVINNGVIWRPEFRFNTRYETDILYVIEEANPAKHQGITFEVSGLSDQDMAEIKMSCLQMQSFIGQVKETSKGQILLDQGSRLYVGGLYICDTDLKYGYNIKPEFVRLERDRRTVDSWDLKNMTRDMWFESMDYEMICMLIEKGTPDLEYAKYNSPEVIKEAVYKYFRANNPGAVVASNQKELDELVARGLKVVIVNDVYHSMVTGSAGYRAEVGQSAKMQTPTEYLDRWFADNRRHMRRDGITAFKDLIAKSKGWRVA